jgi:hypothetical protein
MICRMTSNSSFAFDNSHHREPIGSFISYHRVVKFSCCPMEKEDEECSVVSSSYFIIHFALHLNLIYLVPRLDVL